MKRLRLQLAIGAAALCVGALFLCVAINSVRWIDKTFPGFLIMANRVVPSISLPSWAGGEPARLFQSQVVEVNGEPVQSSREIYERVEHIAPGMPVNYGVRSAAGEFFRALVPARRFAQSDYVFLLGGLLLNGLLFASIGLGVLIHRSDVPAARGLFAAFVTTGVFALTAPDLYGPHWFFRLHVLGECFMGVGFLHLALVFPIDRLGRHGWPVLATAYGAAALLAGFYQWTLYDPVSYTQSHLIATATHGAGGLVMMVSATHALLLDASPATRRCVRTIAIGVVAGILPPAALMAASALLGGSIAINAGVLTAFLFPMTLGYSVVRHDLLGIGMV